MAAPGMFVFPPGIHIGISRFGSNTDFVVWLALGHLGLTPAAMTAIVFLIFG